MKILAIATFIPMPDRTAMHLRFSHLLKILASRHDVSFHAVGLKFQNRHYGEEQVRGYREAMGQIGIECNLGASGELAACLRREPFDLFLFEHYSACWPFALDMVRARRPAARIVIDTVDVNYQRLLTRAQQTEKAEHYNQARLTMREELTAYRRSDMVIAISDAEREILQAEPEMPPVEVIGLINDLPAVPPRPHGAGGRLIFVGNFDWDANVDAMLFFAREVLPRVRRRVPGAHLRIVGNSPTVEVRALQGDGIDVLGFVPDIHQLLLESDISIAPLRFGGGLKGKITEAMTYRLPVVTTALGGVGFGLDPGRNVLIADEPGAFGDAIVELISNAQLYRRLSDGGREFVERNFSLGALTPVVHTVFERAIGFPTRRGALGARLRLIRKPPLDLIEWARSWFGRHILWRFKA